MSVPLRIGVCGIGTAGGAAALFLARQGHNVVVFEKTERRSLETSYAGAGIGLQPIGLRCLQRLGLLESILDHGARIDHLFATTSSGRVVLDLEYADFDSRLFGVGLHRSVLFHELWRSVEEQEGLKVLCGFAVKRVRIANTPTQVDRFPNESFIELDNGERHGPFDMIIVADGRASSIRRNLVENGRFRAFEHWYKYGCLWALLADTSGFLTEKNGPNVLRQKLDTSKYMLGFLPTGRAHKRSKLNSEIPYVSLFWSLELSSVNAVRKAGIDEFKRNILRLDDSAMSLLEQLEMDKLIPAEYCNVFLPRQYYGRCVFLGDAAHATSPQLGQGANLALVDAWKLSVALQHIRNSQPLAIYDALKRYDEDRRWRLRFYQLNSAILTPIFQGNSLTISSLRDLTMGPMCRFAPTRWTMLAVMTGAQKNGIPGAVIPEDEYILQ